MALSRRDVLLLSETKTVTFQLHRNCCSNCLVVVSKSKNRKRTQMSRETLSSFFLTKLKVRSVVLEKAPLRCLYNDVNINLKVHYIVLGEENVIRRLT